MNPFYIIYNVLFYWIIAPLAMFLRLSWLFKLPIDDSNTTNQITIPKKVDSFSLTHSQEAKDTICSLIDSAKTRIYIATFGLLITYPNSKDFTYYVLKKLENAAKRGVDVTIIYDETISLLSNSGLDPSKLLVGINFINHQWTSPFTPYRCFHRKYMIVDDYVYLTSGNLNAQHYGKNAVMVDNVHLTSDPKFLQAYLDIFHHDIEDYKTCVLVDPDCRVSYMKNLESRLIERFDQAQKSIAMISQYFVPPEQLVQSLLRAIQRGVVVDVYLNTSYCLPDYDPLRAKLSKKGIRFHIFNREIIKHSKIILIDANTPNELAILGSFNFTYRTLLVDYENLHEYTGYRVSEIKKLFAALTNGFETYSPRLIEYLPGAQIYPNFLSYIF